MSTSFFGRAKKCRIRREEWPSPSPAVPPSLAQGRLAASLMQSSEAKPGGTPSVTAMPCHLPRGWRLCVLEPAGETRGTIYGG